MGEAPSPKFIIQNFKSRLGVMVHRAERHDKSRLTDVPRDSMAHQAECHGKSRPKGVGRSFEVNVEQLIKAHTESLGGQGDPEPSKSSSITSERTERAQIKRPKPRCS